MQEKNSDNFIYGKNAILEALEQMPARINKIYFAEGINFDARLKRIKELAQEKSIIFKFTNLHNSKFPQGVNLQGVLACVAPVAYYTLEDFLARMDEKEGFKKIFILENVQDPHNLGAIIRTAACSSFDGVIVANHRAAQLNATVEKTSSGAINHVPVVKVNSLSDTIDTLKNRDWWIIGTSARCHDNYFEIDYTDMNFAVILGAEGQGISKTLIKKSDFQVKLPTNFESLNVSATCAVIAYEAVRQNYLKTVKM